MKYCKVQIKSNCVVLSLMFKCSLKLEPASAKVASSPLLLKRATYSTVSNVLCFLFYFRCISTLLVAFFHSEHHARNLSALSVVKLSYVRH